MPGKKKKQFKTAAKRRKVNRAKTTRRRAASSSSKNKPTAAAVLDSQKLQDLYAIMLKTRMLSGRALQLLSTPAKGLPAGAAWKREAVLVGAIAHTLAGDSIATAQSSFLADFIKGASLTSVLEQLSVPEIEAPGTEAANHSGTGSFAEGTMERGLALATEIRGKGNVVVVFPGDVPAGPVTHRERLGLAASNKLPLIWMVEATQSTLEQSSIPDSPATGGNFPRITVDGNDVVAVFRVAQEAVRRARAGHGPSLIECVVPESDPVPARKQTAAACDPLAFMQRYLQRRNLWADEWQKKIADQFSQELELALANGAKLPDRQSAFDRTYSADDPVVRSPQNLPADEKTAPSRA